MSNHECIRIKCYLQRKMLWKNILNHPVSIWNVFTTLIKYNNFAQTHKKKVLNNICYLCQAKVFSDGFTRVKSIIKQSISPLYIILPHYTVGIILASQEALYGRKVREKNDDMLTIPQSCLAWVLSLSSLSHEHVSQLQPLPCL